MERHCQIGWVLHREPMISAGQDVAFGGRHEALKPLVGGAKPGPQGVAFFSENQESRVADLRDFGFPKVPVEEGRKFQLKPGGGVGNGLLEGMGNRVVEPHSKACSEPRSKELFDGGHGLLFAKPPHAHRKRLAITGGARADEKAGLEEHQRADATGLAGRDLKSDRASVGVPYKVRLLQSE
jgi:hypothetical protein